MNKRSQGANRAQWKEHVSAWSRSGLTQTAYCREHGLLPKTLSAWVGRVRSEVTERPAPLKIVPVIVQNAVQSAQATAGPTGPITLQHSNGWQLQFPTEVTASWLGNVLSQLR